MQSLRDKLLKAGLVTEEAAKKAETGARAPKAAPPPRREEPRRPPARDEGPSRLPKFAPLPGSKEAHRLQAKRQLEADRALREKVLATQVPPASGETPFYFVTRKNKLRRLELSAEQAKQLETGELAVVERPDPDKIEHALVPIAAAREILADFPKAIRFLNAPGATVGFLSEQEISTRAHEATTPDVDEAQPGEQASSPDATPQTPPEGETWITVKRAPKAD